MKIKRILVPVDFSDASLQALDYAVDLAKPMAAELIVLFVVEPAYFAAPADLYGPSASLGVLLEEQQRFGAEQLARLRRRLEQRRVKCRTLIQTGVAYRDIVEKARKTAADLIVMSTHGRTGLSHALLGSVAEKVVRMAECPVLTVRAVAAKARRRPVRAKASRRRA